MNKIQKLLLKNNILTFKWNFTIEKKKKTSKIGLRYTKR